MTNGEARDILREMMNDVDPITGEILPEDHLLNDPQVMRALHTAILALKETHEPESSYINRNGKLNAGRPWTKNDDEQLRYMASQGYSLEQICRQMERRPRGVRNRMEYLRIPCQDAAGNSRQKKNAEKELPTNAWQSWLPTDEAVLV